MTDYIERGAAIDACFDGWNNDAHDCAENIRLIPAADVRPVVRGRWIVEAHRTYYDTRCSACGVKSFVSIEPKDTISFCIFCPNCGADMREK